MKTLLLPLCLTVATNLAAQDKAPLTLWTDAGAHGHCQRIQGTGITDRLRPLMHAQVSALEVGEGYRVTLFNGEDGEGPERITVQGPRRVDDLKTLLRLHGTGNWDNAIGSILIQAAEPAAPAALDVLAGTN
ncbi:MAG: hypothetical protein IT228_13955 [Flavobacteriales bacterium]|nr:hypothetical protein [Flavobacteriales bacterium]MCC6578439.1 hypothetical protein [Flavobacteriales bacterium]NUQ15094.1 hypothetical protein [Flavobacteriales bacterium]